MNEAAARPLAVEGISKRFPGVQALSGISFDCRAGEIHALVGENGAGKSTLMRILSGVYQPDEGTIRVSGQPVTVANPAEAARFGIAMVYQDTRLVPDLDVAQNIFLGHEPGGALDRLRRHAHAVGAPPCAARRGDRSAEAGADPCRRRAADRRDRSRPQRRGAGSHPRRADLGPHSTRRRSPVCHPARRSGQRAHRSSSSRIGCRKSWQSPIASPS